MKKTLALIGLATLSASVSAQNQNDIANISSIFTQFYAKIANMYGLDTNKLSNLFEQTNAEITSSYSDGKSKFEVNHTYQQVKLVSMAGLPMLKIGNLTFKDMNRDGRVNRYEDWRLTPEDRARNLLTHMTLEEKAGVMMHGTFSTVTDSDGNTTYDIDDISDIINNKKVNTFITRLDIEPTSFAEENNSLQQIAEQSRLGIPLSISTDPRNSFLYTEGASVESDYFSKWPEALGLGAIGDPDVVKEFADIARQEYLAVGINTALSPQADLYSEPRWARGNGTFGQDEQLAKTLVNAYVLGMQNGNSLNDGSVLTVVKHWVGYGEAKDGWDSHNPYGKYADFHGKDIRKHITPFIGAFDANVASVMPTYSILQGATYRGRTIDEEVGAGFSHFLLTDLLREEYGFQGVIVSDWLITNDCSGGCENGVLGGENYSLGMPWGVEELSEEERFVKAVNAGIDQFGGVDNSEILVEAVKDKKLTEKRLEESALKILIQKFQMGLFENPYVDASKAASIVGNDAHQDAADAAQKNSLVLLKNDDILPIGKNKKIYLYNIDADAARDAGLSVVDNLEDADLAIVRSTAPYETLHPGYLFGSSQHEGSLDYPDDNADLMMVNEASSKGVPTIVTVYLDRPAILTKMQDKVSALIGNFGISDANLFDALIKSRKFEATLPVDLPASMEQVINRESEDYQGDRTPLYSVGYGLAK
ncbi:glycoside hydrolase family 3 protein [Phytohalomonas tamaricis]|uniref:glycoside hydrolase family 3 protein n=1 Tax=Phytohalomonas tamaricis TaxID=2081032 RepID=UPI000D0BC955|nr:glycoside hydrolase family 3 N-terminal domain-containing protein [Phytohalomonas tamaricis]